MHLQRGEICETTACEDTLWGHFSEGFLRNNKQVPLQRNARRIIPGNVSATTTRLPVAPWPKSTISLEQKSATIVIDGYRCQSNADKACRYRPTSATLLSRRPCVLDQRATVWKTGKRGRTRKLHLTPHPNHHAHDASQSRLRYGAGPLEGHLVASWISAKLSRGTVGHTGISR